MRSKRPVKDPNDLIAKKEVHNAWFLWERVTLTKVVDTKSAPTNQKITKTQFYFLFIFFIVVGFVIDWNQSAMDLHVFPIPIPPPTSLSTRSL